MYTYDDYRINAEIMKSRTGSFQPDILIILGSGLGFIADEIENPAVVDYRQNTCVYSSFAPGHKARFIFGELYGKKVCAMQGRLHCYEGYSPEDVAFPVRMLKLMGADKLIVTNAAGCINTAWNKGDIMLISDHIRLFGDSPLRGQNIDELGERFPDMGNVYDEGLRVIARGKAAELGIPLREGVYMYFPGPQFETPAEVRAARILGADAAGMSTVHEATAANQCGMKTLGLTLLSNMAAGIVKEKLSSDDVLEASINSAEMFAALLKACLKEM